MRPFAAFYSSIFLLFFSCKKEERIYYSNGKPKYINTWKNDIFFINRYNTKGNLVLVAKFKNNQLIDTIFVYDQDDYFIKVDSSDYKYFYGSYISHYSTGNISKISPLRFRKGKDLDSILGSSKLFGKETLYNPEGKLARETYYKIINDSSVIINEKIYDQTLMK
ncbi:hypothetical protein AAEU33_14530 [Chryseobacterium sp. Chry.R1]|uniref:hypothetical protein n=1 Tax=Chryseobacterium sp. Chry.R1 TaxID=3139392 RepID=UPI0031F7EC7B